jgi:nucleoid-associated protein EbfC
MQNLNDIMKMAQEATRALEAAQAGLDRIEVEGQSGGGMVKVRASAKGRIVAIDIDPSLLSPEQKDMVEDLLVAAFNDARGKADQVSSAEMQKMTAGLPLPAGFKLPV